MPESSSRQILALTTAQKKTVFTIWIAYAFFYFGRVNLSPVLTSIAESLSISRAEVGMIGTAFFWVYAAGQFINGQMGAHYSPRKIVAVGILLIAMTNILFAFQSALWLMIILWGINGFAQSMGWPPMLRIVAERLDTQQAHSISTILPLSYVVGTTLTWALIGRFAANHWQNAFLIPGITMIALLVYWWVSDVDAPPSTSSGFDWGQIASELRQIWYALFAASMCGFVFFGLIIWLPTYIADSQLVPQQFVGLIAGIMQIIGIPGLLLARYLVFRWESAFKALISLAIAGSFSLMFATLLSGFPTLFALSLAYMCATGLGGLLIGTIPLTLASPGRTSAISGSINAFSNFGGGLSGFAIGAAIETLSWQTAFFIWAIALLIAALLFATNRQKEFQHI